MPSDRSRTDRPAGDRLGDRPDFDDWMRNIGAALESRAAREPEDERTSSERGRGSWFLRAKSFPGILLHR